MTYTTVLHRSKRRAAHKDRGSVLIFVVGVLVLLALSATAFIASTAGDRKTTKQNEFNTQVDLLLEGCRQAVIGKILADTTIPQDFRTNATVDVFSDGFITDTWLASRVPTWANGVPPTTPGPATASNQIRWRHLTRDIFSGGSVFEEPTGRAYGMGGNAIPTSIGLRPALNVGGVNYLASDTDGDGIADAGLVRLPISKINGITYYAAFRVIDHSSAINLATAMSRDYDFDANQSALPAAGYNHAPIGFFPTGVGLAETLKGGTTEFNNLLSFRFSGATTYPDVWNQGSATLSDTQAFRSLGDKFYHQVVRRRDKPFTTSVKTFTATDGVGLAKRFVLTDPTYKSVPEQTLPNSLQTTRTQAYAASQVTDWFNTFFNYDWETAGTPGSYRPIRPIATTSNRQVTGLVPAADMMALVNNAQARSVWLKSGATGDGEMMRFYSTTSDATIAAEAFSKLPEPASVNTADFPDLWRAYWNVMCDPAQPHKSENGWIPTDGANGVLATPSHRWIREAADGTNWTETGELLVRAAQAAVNLMDARDPDEDITIKEIRILGKDGAVYRVFVHGTERQPFITRIVYRSTGTGNTDYDYAAIELYNPYDTPLVMRKGWRIGVFNKNATPPDKYHIAEVGVIPDNTIIPPKDFLVFQSDDPPAGVSVASRTGSPTGSASPQRMAGLGNTKQQGTAASGGLYPYPRDVVLLRPRFSDGSPSADDGATINTIEPTEALTGGKLLGYIPVDMMPTDFDYDPNAALTQPTVGYRERPTGAPWKCVYENPAAAWTSFPADGSQTLALGTANANTGTTVPTIQIANQDAPEPTKVDTTTSPGGYMNYPYGGAGRLGNLLNVPFVGSVIAYKLGTGPEELIDISPTPYSAYFARDTTEGNEGAEPVGRPFADPMYGGSSYDWADDLFTYFTVIGHPGKDYTASLTRNYIEDPMTTPADWRDYFSWIPNAGATGREPTLAIEPLDDDNDYDTGIQPIGSVEGLVNINTASVKVLSMLPWIPGNDDGLTYDPSTNTMTPGANSIPDNVDIARAIVQYRENAGNHQFKHVLELMKIPALRTATTILLTTGDMNDNYGDFTPAGAGNTSLDGVRNDVEENALLITRVSNLITTRSDVFTVYIDLQGWRDAGTANAELVVQRRAAMMVDRSKYVGETPQVITTRVPTD